MNHEALASHRWSTASFSDTTDTSPVELSAMREHMNVCQGSNGRLFAWRCAAERLHGFVASRLVTTLVVAAGVMAAVLFVL